MMAAPETVSGRNALTSNAAAWRPPLLVRAPPERQASSKTTRVLTVDLARIWRSSR